MENIITDTLEKARERARKWYYENKEKVLSERKEYYKTNQDVVKERVKKYRKDNLEKSRFYDKQRSLKPERQEQLKRQRDKHYENNKQDYINRAKQRDKDNPQQALERTRIRRARVNSVEGGHFTDAEFHELCEKYGNKCLRCGNTGKLTADHVIPISLGIPHTDEISNIQPLCLSCNSKKHTKTVDYRTEIL